MQTEERERKREKNLRVKNRNFVIHFSRCGRDSVVSFYLFRKSFLCRRMNNSFSHLSLPPITMSLSFNFSFNNVIFFAFRAHIPKGGKNKKRKKRKKQLKCNEYRIKDEMFEFISVLLPSRNYSDRVSSFLFLRSQSFAFFSELR